MNHSLKRLLVIGLAITAITMGARADKDKFHEKEDPIVGVWTFRLESMISTMPNEGVIRFNDDGTSIDMGSINLNQPADTGVPGSYTTAPMGLWKRVGKCRYRNIKTTVATEPGPAGIRNIPVSRTVTDIDIIISTDGKSFEGLGTITIFRLEDSACLENVIEEPTPVTIIGCKVKLCPEKKDHS